MGRKPADLWRYADRMDKKFKCKFCKIVFPGGVVRLRAHLSGTKGQGIQVCGKVLKDVRDDALLASNVPNTKSKTDASSSNSDGSSSMISDSSCRNEVDTSLAKFFEMNELPCCIVESPSFINLVNVLVKSGSGYVLPSCSMLENQLIPSLRQEVEQYVSSTRQSWEEIGCTLTSDIWLNEEENRSFVSIMACSGKRAVLLNTFDIPDNNLTAGFLEGIVHRVVQDVGVGNIVQYIGDDSPYTKLFSELLGRQCPLVFVTRCVVRELQSLFEEVIQKVESVGSTFQIAKYLVDCLCKDDDLSALMRKYTGGKELEHSSRYDMLESIFEVKEELVKLVQSAEWFALGYDQRENGKKATEIITSEEFWKQGGEVQMVLKPLLKILQLDDTADSGFGYLYGLMKMMEEAIVSLHNNNRVKFQKLWEIFLSKKGQIINETHKAAAYLNPSYMCNVTVQESRAVEKGINYILQKFVAGADEVAFVEQAMHYRQTLSNPSERLKIVAAKTFSPGQWWNAFGNEFPILRKYAIRILNQPCGRSSFNINLSAFRANLVKQRGLVPDLKDLNVRINLVLMEKSCADSAKSKRINFEEFNRHKLTTNESSDAVLVEAARDPDEETRLLRTGEELPRPKDMKLSFMTVIASPILTGQKVEGYQGSPIHVYLADSTTGSVVQDGAPSILTLTISVLDGDFNNEGPSDEYRSREYFDSNDLSSEMMPLLTGDLQVVLMRGMGMLGDFSFNYSSRHTRSGKFRLAVKTDTGDCEGIRIFEGISNAFVVEDSEVTRTQHPAACEMHLPKDSDFLSIIGRMEDLGGLEQQMFVDSSGPPGDWGQLWNYNQLQGGRRCQTQAAAAAARVRVRDEVVDPTEAHSTGGNNVNKQEDGEGNDEPMVALNGGTAGGSNSVQPGCPEVTLFGVRVAPNSSGAEESLEVGSPVQHLSTTLQLSLTGDGNEVMELQHRGGLDSKGSDNNIKPKYNSSKGEGIDKLEDKSDDGRQLNYFQYNSSKGEGFDKLEDESVDGRQLNYFQSLPFDRYTVEEADHERYGCGSDPGQGRLRRRLAYGAKWNISHESLCHSLHSKGEGFDKLEDESVDGRQLNYFQSLPFDRYTVEEADHERYGCGSDPGQGRLRRRLAYGAKWNISHESLCHSLHSKGEGFDKLEDESVNGRQLDSALLLIIGLILATIIQAHLLFPGTGMDTDTVADKLGLAAAALTMFCFTALVVLITLDSPKHNYQQLRNKLRFIFVVSLVVQLAAMTYTTLCSDLI